MTKLLFEVQTGSRAMGLETEKSDYDTLRVVAHSPDEYLGFMPYKETEQVIDSGNDVVTMDVRQFGRLLAAGNPNAVLSLFFDDMHVINVDIAFCGFTFYRKHFVSELTVKSFRGYAKNLYAEFEKKGDWKRAANALWILCALYYIVRTGEASGVSNHWLSTFRVVKAGNIQKRDVEELFDYFFELTTLENLEAWGTLHSSDEVYKNVNREVIKTLKECLGFLS